MNTKQWAPVGIIGCGSIFAAYERACREYGIPIAAIADTDEDRARACAREYDLAFRSVDALLADSAITTIVNLTPPAAHADVALAAIAAGKHVYGEKPLATTRAEVDHMLRAADAAGVRVGCAPDTWLATPCRTAAQCIADGSIGEIVGVSAAMMIGGHESWHPNPHYYYQPGAGPLFDMGPYYVSQLIALCGPILSSHAHVHTPGRARRALDGSVIDVSTPTHVMGSVQFAHGAVGTISMSFDAAHHTLPHIEIYGTTGSLRLPDPNTYAGPVLRTTRERPYWHAVRQVPGSLKEMRGMGLVHFLDDTDLAGSARTIGAQVVGVMEDMLGDAVATRADRADGRDWRVGPVDALVVQSSATVEPGAREAAADRLRALIIAGGWDGHAPMETSAALVPYLAEAGVDAEIATDVSVLLDAEYMAAFDVIVPNMTMGDLPRGVEVALCNAVESGTGLAGWHGGCGDAFRSATDYQHMVGGQFVAHPGGLNTTYAVRVLDDHHDIMNGIGDFQITTEQYYMHIDPAIQVLASTMFGAVEMPVAWTKHHGDGRVFYQSIGHDVDALMHPEVRALTVNGIRWAGVPSAQRRMKELVAHSAVEQA